MNANMQVPVAEMQCLMCGACSLPDPPPFTQFQSLLYRPLVVGNQQDIVVNTPAAMATGRSEGRFRFGWGGWGGRRTRAGGNANAAPALLEPVYALVIERESRNAEEARVLFGRRGFRRDPHGDPIMAIEQLTDAVAHHVKMFHGDFVFDGEPLVFGEEPRENGDPNDRTSSPAKPLRSAMIGHHIAGGKLDPARRGDAGEQNPYFVLVTRGTGCATKFANIVD